MLIAKFINLLHKTSHITCLIQNSELLFINNLGSSIMKKHLVGITLYPHPEGSRLFIDYALLLGHYEDLNARGPQARWEFKSS